MHRVAVAIAIFAVIDRSEIVILYNLSLSLCSTFLDQCIVFNIHSASHSSVVLSRLISLIFLSSTKSIGNLESAAAKSIHRRIITISGLRLHRSSSSLNNRCHVRLDRNASRIARTMSTSSSPFLVITIRRRRHVVDVIGVVAFLLFALTCISAVELHRGMCAQIVYRSMTMFYRSAIFIVAVNIRVRTERRSAVSSRYAFAVVMFDAH